MAFPLMENAPDPNASLLAFFLPALLSAVAGIFVLIAHRLLRSGSGSAPAVGPSPEVEQKRQSVEQAHQQAEQAREQQLAAIDQRQSKEVSQIIEREQARAAEVLQAIDEEDKTPVGTSPHNQGALDEQTDWLLQQGRAAQGAHPPRGSR